MQSRVHKTVECLSIRLSQNSTAATMWGGFAAEHCDGNRYRLTMAATRHLAAALLSPPTDSI